MTNAISSGQARGLGSAGEPRARIAAGPAQTPAARDKRARSLWPVVWSTLYVVALLGVLAAAYAVREEEYIIPKRGTGYWIGILGGLILLSLLLYPLRKKHAREAKYGSVTTWFRLHMILGVLGPALILLHSNFQLKSVNATVATVIMLTVVASGIIGRFLYRRVHKGLYDKKAEVTALLYDADVLYDAFGDDMRWAPDIMEQLKDFQGRVLQAHTNPVQSLAFIARSAVETRASHRQIARRAREILHERAQAERWPKEKFKAALEGVNQHLDGYFRTVRQAAELKFYSRLFGLWHVLHLPLYLLLIVAAVVHIIAVHLY